MSCLFVGKKNTWAFCICKGYNNYENGCDRGGVWILTRFRRNMAEDSGEFSKAGKSILRTVVS